MKSVQQSYVGKRFEFKYFLSIAEAKSIECYLIKRAKLNPDFFSQSGDYFVNSLYFDTPHMSDYREKDGSFLIRKKLRARMYESSWNNGHERVWLEVKHKHNMNIRKTRSSISGHVWNKFITENNPTVLLENLEDPATDKPEHLAHFAHCHLRQFYKPVAVVRYRRLAYLANFTSLVRITFDHDIQTCRFEDYHNSENLLPVSHQAVIMEVKFNNKLPWWFTDLLQHFDLRRTDFSKYRNSVAVMRGIQRIPINK